MVAKTNTVYFISAPHVRTALQEGTNKFCNSATALDDNRMQEYMPPADDGRVYP